MSDERLFSDFRFFDIPTRIGSCCECNDIVDIFCQDEPSPKTTYLCARCAKDMGFSTERCSEEREGK